MIILYLRITLVEKTTRSLTSHNMLVGYFLVAMFPTTNIFNHPDYENSDPNTFILSTKLKTFHFLLNTIIGFYLNL